LSRRRTSTPTAAAPTPWTRAGRRGSRRPGTPSMRRCSVIGAAYPCLAIRATFSGPAPRPHPLALSGVETPVNLAFVEATYCTGVGDGFLEWRPQSGLRAERRQGGERVVRRA